MRADRGSSPAFAARALRRCTTTSRHSRDWLVRFGDGTDQIARALGCARPPHALHPGNSGTPSPAEEAALQASAGLSARGPAQRLERAHRQRAARNTLKRPRRTKAMSRRAESAGVTAPNTWASLLARMQSLARAHPTRAGDAATDPPMSPSPLPWTSTPFAPPSRPLADPKSRWSACASWASCATRSGSAPMGRWRSSSRPPTAAQRPWSQIEDDVRAGSGAWGSTGAWWPKARSGMTTDWIGEAAQLRQFGVAPPRAVRARSAGWGTAAALRRAASPVQSVVHAGQAGFTRAPVGKRQRTVVDTIPGGSQ